jgi:carbamoyltransferase
MKILGISAFYHDSAAALVVDGKIVAAAQEERFTRIKGDQNFPKHSAKFCLAHAGIEASALDAVAFYDKPLLKFDRLLETYLVYAPRGLKTFLQAMPLWLKEKLWMEDTVKAGVGYDGEVYYPEHHESHAASAFFPSPFESAAVITMDGVGEWCTTSWGVGRDNTVELKKEIHFPHSLGLLYSAFTYYAGFKVNSGEYKVMGLAPYGEPKYVPVILERLIDVAEDGSFKLNMDYFNYPAGLTMTNEAFDELFGGPPRRPETLLTQREMDLARSVQDVTELVMLRMARHVRKESGEKNLCLAGGVALNCVANGRILRAGIFDSLWIQPAAGDAGGAIGAALHVWHNTLKKPRQLPANGKDMMDGAYLGPGYDSKAIREMLDARGIPYRVLGDDEMLPLVARELANEKVIGWFNGRMEFGPRALGSRSILGDPRSPKMQSVMNLKIKYRESFRPFAPSVLVEDTREWFDLDHDSPYMLLVAPVQAKHRKPMTAEQEQLFGIEKLNVARSTIPAVTHVDYSARVQTVDREVSPRYHRLISEFKKLTGVGVLINTSFNVRGEPIVQHPMDAYTCFMRTEIDILVGTKKIREFALVVGGVLVLIGGIIYWRNPESGKPLWFFGIGTVLALLGLIAPRILKPVYQLWMALAYQLGRVMTNVLLTVFYIIGFGLVSLILRIVGKDPLDRKWTPGKGGSYWRDRDVITIEDRDLKPY